jgi:hypothetical protein
MMKGYHEKFENYNLIEPKKMFGYITPHASYTTNIGNVPEVSYLLRIVSVVVNELLCNPFVNVVMPTFAATWPLF